MKTTILSSFLLLTGCAVTPQVAEHIAEAAIVDEVTVALDAVGEQHIINDPWLILGIVVVLVASPYIFGKAVWLTVGKLLSVVLKNRKNGKSEKE